MKLGIDLDGVVVNFHDTANEYLADLLNVAPAPVTEWEWHHGYVTERGVSRRKTEKAWRAMWREANDGKLFADCAPIPGALPGLKLLKELGHEITYITHRSPTTEAVTRSWLWLYSVEAPVHHVKDKASILCDLYLDDKPENIEELRAQSRTAYLFEAPHNGWARLPRVWNWADFVGTVDFHERWSV